MLAGYSIIDQNDYYVDQFDQTDFDLVDIDDQESKCEHDTYEAENGLHVCRKCHLEMEIHDFNPEWKYYNSDGSGKDPSRCHKPRNINKGLENLFAKYRIDLPDAIKEYIKMKHEEIINNYNNPRGFGRTGIVAACTFFALKYFNYDKTTDYVRGLFGIRRKCISYGIKVYLTVNPEERTRLTEPKDLLGDIMRSVGLPEKHKSRILCMIEYYNQTSSSLTRCGPQSVTSALIWFYICINPEFKSRINLTKTGFCEKAGLSEITITRIAREALTIGLFSGSSPNSSNIVELPNGNTKIIFDDGTEQEVLI